MPGRQPHVLVELADPGPRGVHGTVGDLRRQRLVDGQGSRTRRHPEQGVGLAPQQGGDGVGDQLAARPGVRNDDNFHAWPADLRWDSWYRPI